jgi:hypothetical protein
VFLEARASWRRKIKRRVAVLAGVTLALGVLAGFLLPKFGQFIAGMMVGGVVDMVIWVWDSPPPYIENWRAGRDGERWTEKELKPLKRERWKVQHDLDSGYRSTNIDHVAVGPGGVFLLNSKNLWGSFVIESGILSCHQELAPASDYTLPNLERQMWGAARGLEKRLKDRVGWIVDVRSVVVLWAKFEAREGALVGGAAVVRGDCIADWLRTQPERIAEKDLPNIVDAVGSLRTATASAVVTGV